MKVRLRHKTVLLVIVAVAVVSLAAVLVVAPRINDWLAGNVTVHVEMSITYQGNWSGNYTYGLCGSSSSSHFVPINGSGSSFHRVFAFQGNWNTGFGFSFRVQKQDNSSEVLSAIATASSLGSVNKSTAAPEGVLDWGVCAIS